MNNETDYYTISDVSKKLNIPTHVLRFWEKKVQKGEDTTAI